MASLNKDILGLLLQIKDKDRKNDELTWKRDVIKEEVK